MRYELLLQALVPGEAVDWEGVVALARAKGATALPAGGHTLALKAGAVEIHPLREQGTQVGLEVHLPLLGDDALAREAVATFVALAQEAKVRLFDPQLLKPLEGDQVVSAVAEQYLRTARYAGEMLGESSALGAVYGDTQDGGFSPTTKLVLGLVGVFALLFAALELWVRAQSGF